LRGFGTEGLLGIEGSTHRCRHVYATRLLRSGANVTGVQRLMRHGSLETTAAYTAVDEGELRGAVKLL
jgi:site-specific recombinase XerD